MSTEKERLEAEIAQRDARISELEAQQQEDAGTINDLLASIGELKASRPSAGVVLPEQAAFLAWGEAIGMTMNQLTAGELAAFKVGAAWRACAVITESAPETLKIALRELHKAGIKAGSLPHMVLTNLINESPATPSATADAVSVPRSLLAICFEGFDDYWITSPEGVECTKKLRALLADRMKP